MNTALVLGSLFILTLICIFAKAKLLHFACIFLALASSLMFQNGVNLWFSVAMAFMVVYHLKKFMELKVW